MAASVEAMRREPSRIDHLGDLIRKREAMGEKPLEFLSFGLKINSININTQVQKYRNIEQ